MVSLKLDNNLAQLEKFWNRVFWKRFLWIFFGIQENDLIDIIITAQ
jgi:hypothetical protein